MANTQFVVVTAVPLGLQVDPQTIKVSVLVSPRLTGEDRLRAYPDWRHWTQHVKDVGLRVTFECAGVTLDRDVDTSSVRTDLWEALFDDATYVRSHTFDDHYGHFISSYNTRAALATIKATYQRVGVEFAVPDGDGDIPTSKAPYQRVGVEFAVPGVDRRRRRFRQLLENYALDWSEDMGRRLLAGQRRGWHDRLALAGMTRAAGAGDGLDPSGQVITGLDTESDEFHSIQQQTVHEWGVYNHMPQGADVTRQSLDADQVLDFHQALSAVAAYRTMQRHLGVVFDLDLPLHFVAETPVDGHGELKITAVDGHWSPDTATTVPITSTAYVHSVVRGTRLFAVAPLTVLEKSQRPAVFGMLNLDKRWFGVAQVDVDGALHKTVMHADNLSGLAGESVPPNPEVFDPATTLSSLRSGGLSVFADTRAATMLDSFMRTKQHNDDLTANRPQQTPFCAEDLTRGYRLDIWDSVTREWHSLHRRNTDIHVGADDIAVTVNDEEGYFQAVITKPAPDENGARASDDLYLHEAMVRWSGWSLSAAAIGNHLTRDGDPAKAMPDPADPDPENQAVTPFKLTSTATHVPGSLPRLRFGVGYRLRLRQVDIAGNGLHLDDAAVHLVTPIFSMPRGDGVIPYLRFEPVAAPVVVLRDKLGLTGRGSATDRLVIRTFNTDPSLDSAAADLTASDRHIAPPRVHVEMAERHGMFDEPNGRLNSTPAMWELIKNRDAGAFTSVQVDDIVIDGQAQVVPIESRPAVDVLPYLPDPLARAAAFRDLPGTSGATIGRVAPGEGKALPVKYVTIDDPQPRGGTATIVEFGGRADWQQVLPFRLALADGTAPPQWDPQVAVLTVSLPKGTTRVVPMSSCCDAEDLKYLGVWAWLREYLEFVSVRQPDSEFIRGPAAKDRVAHILQLATEGGHGMLTPPHLLTLVHAVQQPIGSPTFQRLAAQFQGGAPSIEVWSSPLLTQPESAPTAETELDVLTSWRELGSTDAYLIGALQIHAASTAKIDITAQWSDPFDDLVADPTEQQFSAPVDEVPLATLSEGLLKSNSESRYVGWYDADHDLIAFVPGGARLGDHQEGQTVPLDAAPRHRVGDTKHHIIRYTAVATSRYREYFDPDENGQPRDFTRPGAPVLVHVPASARPVAPKIRYVLPTFGWERVASGNQIRSMRTGGGLRVYLDRPWHSSGDGELLGVTLAHPAGLPLNREDWKGYITQWGEDPIWQSAPLAPFPHSEHFPDRIASEYGLPLDAQLPDNGDSRLVDVVGHAVHFDHARRMYYCDLTVDTRTTTYATFVRLALARYQPHALVEAKLSRVVLADFAQLTPERALTVTVDPFTPGQLQLAVSGPASLGPVPNFLGWPVTDRPTSITVTVQEKDPKLASDLAWTTTAAFAIDASPRDPEQPPDTFILWSGTVRNTAGGAIEAGRYRLLIQEHELYEVDRSKPDPGGPDDVDLDLVLPALGSRLVYAETVPLDDALLRPPHVPAATTAV